MTEPHEALDLDRRDPEPLGELRLRQPQVLTAPQNPQPDLVEKEIAIIGVYLLARRR